MLWFWLSPEPHQSSLHNRHSNLSNTMDVDTPPHLDNPLPAEAEPTDKENGVTGAGTEVPTEGDVDMDAQGSDQPSLGTKQFGASTSGAGVTSGIAGGDAGPVGRTSGTGETGEAFPTRVADFFKPRPKGTNGTSSAKGKGKQSTSEEYLSGREGLPWCVTLLVSTRSITDCWCSSMQG